ncbi:glycerophosphodiester phosphodiesterase, partial [bacterium]|nr:glycerophosphodiester phosphodiesterase [bacterium]
METDVHTTKDGKLVAFHDDKLDRVTDSKGKVGDFTFSDLSHALIDGSEPIPLLIELLEEFPDANFNIDPKHDAAVKPLAELIIRTNSTNRVCVGSFSDERIKRVAKLIGPKLCTGMGPKSISK